ITTMDHEIINRYIGQPSRLPPDVRAALERAWGGEPVQLYALADLDDTLHLGESWVALGPTQVAIARREQAGAWTIASHARARVRTVQETPGLSANTL